MQERVRECHTFVTLLPWGPGGGGGAWRWSGHRQQRGGPGKGWMVVSEEGIGFVVLVKTTQGVWEEVLTGGWWRFESQGGYVVNGSLVVR